MQRTTVLLDPKLHRALKLRAAVPGAPSISEQINDAVRRSLAEDEADAASVRRVLAETPEDQWVTYEDAVRSLKESGRL